ncbi:hypothetical protein GGI35DRAFT_493705 [Trichoderma velutinum]
MEFLLKPKISYYSATSETRDDNENEGDDEVEYYEVEEDEDEDEDGQDGNENKQQHDKDENEIQSGKAKEYLSNQQAWVHNFDRVKLHDVQIRSLQDRCTHMQESYRIEKQARMDLQLTVEKLMQRVENLEETIQNQEERNKEEKKAIIKYKIRLDRLENLCGTMVNTIVELQTAVFGPEESQS